MKTILFLLLPIFCVNINAQDKYQWELTDSTVKTKSQIYSDTKLFIAEMWKSSNAVIQNDDKENGVILIKGINEISTTINMGLQQLTYYFSYTVKFQMKDKKYRIILDNVYCDNAVTTGTYNAKVIPINNYTTLAQIGLPKKQYWEVMNNLKIDLSGIISLYQNYINKPSIIDTF